MWSQASGWTVWDGDELSALVGNRDGFHFRAFELHILTCVQHEHKK